MTHVPQKTGILSESEGVMTSFRLDSIRRGRLLSSEIVDGLDDNDQAVKLVLANCRSGHCKLYRDDVLIAEMNKCVWSLAAPTGRVRNKASTSTAATSEVGALNLDAIVAAQAA
jgi:hypothetical protein